METWILIIFLFGNVSIGGNWLDPISVHHIEFNSAKKCDNARQAIQARKIISYCLPKGNIE